MVVQDKNRGEVRICIDLRKLNDVCLHDSFLTPFMDEVLEVVGSQEIYSFTNGFSSYHQIKLQKRITTRQHLLLNGVVFNTL